MELSDIIYICGENYILSKFENNQDLHYNLEEGGTIHFLLDNVTNTLLCIELTSEN